MQLARLTTQLYPGVVRDQKPVDIGQALHPQGMPPEVDFPIPEDVAVRLHPPQLQPEVVVSVTPQPDIAAALQTQDRPVPQSFPENDFSAILNPPELQPAPAPVVTQAPVNIRQILECAEGRLAENLTGSLTYLD